MSWRASATLALVAWGALAFGAVYTWAFVPLFAGCAAVGMAACVSRGAGRMDRLVAASLALVMAAIVLQLVPLRATAIGSLSPQTDVILRRYVVGYPDTMTRHPLSIDPRLTAIALAATAALTVFLLGLARALTHDDTSRIARGVAVLGVVLSVAGVVQKAMWNGKLYGFWTPISVGTAFGPFVNHNHFAGWTLMALSLTIGYFCGRVARGMRHVKRDWRNRVIWFSSADASETILVGFAALTMAVALMVTMSRSGMLGLAAALVISIWFVARRQAAGSRTIAAGYLAFLLVVAIGWVGFDALAARFSEGEVVDLDGRLAIWADTWQMAARFPLTGIGLNTFGVATLFYQTANPALHFAQAHNDYLQLAAEGGALVGIPAVLALLAVAWRIRRRFDNVSPGSSDDWIRIGAVTGLVAVALQETAEFSLQIPGNAVLFAVLLAIALRQPAEVRRLQKPA